MLTKEQTLGGKYLAPAEGPAKAETITKRTLLKLDGLRKLARRQPRLIDHQTINLGSFPAARDHVPFYLSHSRLPLLKRAHIRRGLLL
jgi:hypothetical protein